MNDYLSDEGEERIQQEYDTLPEKVKFAWDYYKVLKQQEKSGGNPAIILKHYLDTGEVLELEIETVLTRDQSPEISMQ